MAVYVLNATLPELDLTDGCRLVVAAFDTVLNDFSPDVIPTNVVLYAELDDATEGTDNTPAGPFQWVPGPEF